MTPTTLDLYMISRLTPLTTALEFVLVIGFFATIASLIAWVNSIDEESDQNTILRNLHCLALTAVVTIVAGILRILVPTTKEAFAMIVIPRAAAAAESQCLKDLAPKAIEAAKTWLDSIVKEAK